jgi:two-component system, LytTR family, response regulator
MESKYTCLIADDEFPAHEVLQILLEQYPELRLLKSCYNGEDALHEINTNIYDIVFLDVNMPQLSGIELLAQVAQKPAIIITTAYNTFAFEAYQNDVIDYLQKPISLDRFSKAVAKAMKYAKEKRTEQQQFVVLKIDGLTTKVNLEDIMYIRSMVNHSKYFLKNRAKPVLIHESFSKQFTKLTSHLFMQIHRTCIVNKNYIRGRKENELIVDNILLPIGRKYISDIQSLLIKLSL